MRSQFAEYEARTGNRAKELNAHPCPAFLEYIWLWFSELCASRGGSGSGANPVTWLEIEAWARLTGRAPNQFELSALRRLDLVWLRETSTKGGAG